MSCFVCEMKWPPIQPNHQLFRTIDQKVVIQSIHSEYLTTYCKMVQLLDSVLAICLLYLLTELTA